MSAPTITVEVAPGEMIDKITILNIKAAKISDAAKLKNVHVERDVLLKTLHDAVPSSPELDALTDQLQTINEKLWVIEDDIRDCERAKDFSDTFIQLARSVYVTNDERAAVKRQINELLGSRIVEEKSYAEYK